jgi:serine/threonine protein phosphatase PrpC
MESTIFRNVNEAKYNIQIGHDSKKGTGLENQDDRFIIHKPEIDLFIIGVADGHGPTGKLASTVCKTATTEFVDANMEELVADPVSFLEKCFAHAQISVRNAIAQKGIAEGAEVKMDSFGVVLKRKYNFEGFLDVKGGAMLSIVILKAGIMYIANVGDCDAILCAESPILKPSMLKYEKDAANPTKTVVYADETLSDTLILTCDHSPDNPEEYKRIRTFKPSYTDPNQAVLLCVYDEQGTAKPECEPIFKFSEDGTPIVREDAPFYFKNVRNDRATYITTPFDACFTDALASTRSIGDFNLNQYGMSEKPEIQSLDLSKAFGESTTPLCFIMGSDGVWDNWKYDYAQKFVMYTNCLDTVLNTPDDAPIIADPKNINGAQRVMNSFMLRNLTFSEKNFGRYNYDDYTGVIMYISLNQ